MNTEKRESRWARLQRGQAMMEYWPAIPIAIAIMISAGALAQMLSGAFLSTADALNRSGMGVEVCNDTVENTDGPDNVVMDDHKIETCSNVYDPETDTTTFCFTVTTGCSPSISHWTLGLPKAVADKLIDSSEAYENWGTDPTTGVTGIKFDTGYECDASSEEEGGKEKPPKGGKKVFAPVGDPRLVSRVGTNPVMQIAMPATGDSRDIFMVLSGQYEWEPVEVAVKAGTETYVSTISAPAAPVTEETAPAPDPTDLIEADNLHEGCE
jgi:hypothetical protein